MDAAHVAIDDELDRIVQALDEGVHKLPVAAIEEARQHRELIVPRLIDVIREAEALGRAGKKAEGNAHFFALFLLAEFRAKEAFPAIVEALTLPGTASADLFGDALYEHFPRFIALFGDDAPEFVDRLLASRDLDEFVRWSILKTYHFLVRDGRLSLSEAVGRFKALLRQAIDQEDLNLITALITELCELNPQEAYDSIAEAFERDLVDTSMINWKNVEEVIAKGEANAHEHLARLPPTAITDTVAELRHWACFDETPRRAPPAFPPESKVPATTMPATVAPAPRLAAESVASFSPSLAKPVVNEHARVGRNDPCPCGSGKKFKKCCSRQ